jgi:hypothetical protein
MLLLFFVLKKSLRQLKSVPVFAKSAKRLKESMIIIRDRCRSETNDLIAEKINLKLKAVRKAA